MTTNTSPTVPATEIPVVAPVETPTVPAVEPAAAPPVAVPSIEDAQRGLIKAAGKAATKLAASERHATASNITAGRMIRDAVRDYLACPKTSLATGLSMVHNQLMVALRGEVPYQPDMLVRFAAMCDACGDASGLFQDMPMRRVRQAERLFTFGDVSGGTWGTADVRDAIADEVAALLADSGTTDAKPFEARCFELRAMSDKRDAEAAKLLVAAKVEAAAKLATPEAKIQAAAAITTAELADKAALKSHQAAQLAWMTAEQRKAEKTLATNQKKLGTTGTSVQKPSQSKEVCESHLVELSKGTGTDNWLERARLVSLLVGKDALMILPDVLEALTCKPQELAAIGRSFLCERDTIAALLAQLAAHDDTAKDVFEAVTAFTAKHAKVMLTQGDDTDTDDAADEADMAEIEADMVAE